jgi:hypothetical protein
MAIVEETNRIFVAQKLKATVNNGVVHYFLSTANEEIPLNALLGKTITLSFSGTIECIGCARKIKKSFQQGYCFPCTQTLARCDLCIVRPEKCHYHLGSCREPEWAASHCMIPHIIYIANTSGLKVGITRENQIPTRWIDQGATQALALARVANRYHSGLLEVALAKTFADKTDWRKMLKFEAEKVDLEEKRKEIQILLREILASNLVSNSLPVEMQVPEFLETATVELQYPILEYPAKVQSLNLDKTPHIEGRLLGIKGQYLILDIGVLNVRNIAGYQITINS